MNTHRVSLVLSALGYVGFNAVMVWMVVFLAGAHVPRGVDGRAATSTPTAVLTDLALLLLFALQHSVMARRTTKAWLGRRVPLVLERTTYVLATDLCLALLLVRWQPFGGELWHVHGPAAVAVWVLFALGWAVASAATLAVDQLELTGLRQAGWGTAREASAAGLHVDGLYAVVRHPLMTGLLVAFWATPRMGASHLLLAVGATTCIVVGTRFEERDLRRTFGAAYDAYAARVPALLPRPWPRSTARLGLGRGTPGSAPK